MKLLLTLGTLAALSAPAHADRRSFTYTYEYVTMGEGETAVELYNTQSLTSFDDGSPRAYQLQVELEHGITNHLDIALYHVFSQVSAADPLLAAPLTFDEIKLRARYRFGERGELPIDPLLYVELKKEFAESVYEAEVKGVASRDFGALTAVVNAVAEVAFGPDAESELEAGWAAGLTYEASPTWRIGFETYGGFELEEIGDAAASIGPAVSWAASRQAWIGATAGFGLTDTANDLDARVILGLEL
ncbi:MAG: hypothetical protein R2939_17310 [Kofleriaceae bacterium]